MLDAGRCQLRLHFLDCLEQVVDVFRVLGVVGMRFGAAGNVILRRDVVPRGLPILADKVRVG